MTWTGHTYVFRSISFHELAELSISRIWYIKSLISKRWGITEFPSALVISIEALITSHRNVNTMNKISLQRVNDFNTAGMMGNTYSPGDDSLSSGIFFVAAERRHSRAQGGSLHYYQSQTQKPSQLFPLHKLKSGQIATEDIKNNHPTLITKIPSNLKCRIFLPNCCEWNIEWLIIGQIEQARRYLSSVLCVKKWA